MNMLSILRIFIAVKKKLKRFDETEVQTHVSDAL
jgi:hypothetical protein